MRANDERRGGAVAAVAVLALLGVPLAVVAGLAPGEDPGRGGSPEQRLSPARGLAGWRILGPEYQAGHPLDGLDLEWDYFMVHDDDWTGIVGYVLADPKQRLGGDDARVPLTPSGGNVAVAGEFLADQRRVANFVDFGVAATTASGTERTFFAEDPDTGHRAQVEVIPERHALRLTGRTGFYEWDFEVTQDWKERSALIQGPDSAFSPVYGRDVGVIPGEYWTVDMVWPRTRVVGWITRRDTGETFEVSGHGYREDSFGRFNFASDGWDFGIFSSDASQVQVAWQAYRNGIEHKYLDVSFVEDGELRTIRYRSRDGELGWTHPGWKFDASARQCSALDTVVVADDGRYRVDMRVRIGDRHAPLLSAATLVTDAYVIMEHFPDFEGTITNLTTGRVVARFAGQGGGELASPRSIWPERSPSDCSRWGGVRYSQAMPRSEHGGRSLAALLVDKLRLQL